MTDNQTYMGDGQSTKNGEQDVSLARLEQDLIHLKELTQEHFDAMSEALKLQRTEYLRRLDDLNGESGRLKDMQASYLPREVHDAWADTVQAQIDAVKVLQARNLPRETHESWAKDVDGQLTVMREAVTKNLPRTAFEDFVKANKAEMDDMKRLVYIAVGLFTALELLLKFIVK